MIVGVPKEVKTHEYRVGLTPTSVREVAAHGHQVVVETNAGAGIGAPDAAYSEVCQLPPVCFGLAHRISATIIITTTTPPAMRSAIVRLRWGLFGTTAWQVTAGRGMFLI